jgi:dihydroorotase
MTVHPSFDLVISAGRVVCRATNFDGPGVVALRGDRIAAVGRTVAGPARARLDFPDALLLPGLVDFHAHPALGGSKYGINPDRYMLPTGVTTVLSQGDAGAWTWPDFRDDVVRGCRTRVRMALNLAAPGEARPLGCFTDPSEIDVAACIAVLGDGGDDLWGLSVNASRFACGSTDPKWAVDRALEVAHETAKPILYGPRQPADWPLADQLARLRPGDVVTYCFDPNRNVLGEDGRVLPAVWEAKARGIRFDVGPGVGAFDFEVCRRALADGFQPDTISSDLYGGHLGRRPRHDLPRVLSNLIACGMPEQAAFAAVTNRPAEMLGLAGEVGTLAVGACADLALLRRQPNTGVWEAVETIRAGKLVRGIHHESTKGRKDESPSG